MPLPNPRLQPLPGMPALRRRGGRVTCLCWTFWLVLCGLFAWPGLAQATPETPTDVARLAHGLPLQGQLAVQADQGWTVDDLRQGAGAAGWQVPTDTLRAHPGQGPLWMKATLAHSGGASDWLLAFASTAINRIELHGPYDAQGRALAPPQRTGMDQPYASRPLGSERFVLPLQLPGPGLYTVYLRVQADTSQNLTPSLWSPTDFLAWRQHKRLFDGICYGILLTLLVYNLSLALALRDATYAYYVLTCGFALATLGSFNGHTAHYLWPEWPWLIERANVLMAALWIASSALFARRFLDTQQMSRPLDRTLQLYVLLALGGAVLGLLGQLGWAQMANEVLSFSGVLLMSGAAIWIWRKGFLPARWYLAGQASLFASVLGVVLVNWEVLSLPFLEANGLQLGVSLEMVVFALALSARVRVLHSRRLELEWQTRELAHRASSDSLTGVANRRGLLARAEAMLQQPQAHTLLLLDLDRFKPINDTHGHAIGDRVLQVVAQRLQSQLRDADLVGRLGGDEFVVLLQGQQTEAGLELTARRLHQAIVQPITVDALSLTVDASIGIARHPRDGQSLQALLQAADLAMYRAKKSRGRFALYERGLDDQPADSVGVPPSAKA